MITVDELASGTTLAEAQGWSEEMGRAAAELAGRELEAGRLEIARQILEGLAITNPQPQPTQIIRRERRVRAMDVSSGTMAADGHGRVDLASSGGSSPTTDKGDGPRTDKRGIAAG